MYNLIEKIDYVKANLDDIADAFPGGNDILGIQYDFPKFEFDYAYKLLEEIKSDIIGEKKSKCSTLLDVANLANSAAIQIQRIWRGWRVRNYWPHCHNSSYNSCCES